MNRRLLSTYLNDHLGGATGGRELARRAAASNRDTAYGPFLAELAREVEEDRRALLQMMRSLGIRPDRVKQAAGWSAEKLGRLKPNGQLRGYSPLSRVVELEGLLLGVTGKAALWGSLLLVAEQEPAFPGQRLQELQQRAEQQRAGLESHRRRAVLEAISR